jgi:bacillopeptidase F
MAYTNTPTIIVSGSFDGYASGVNVRLGNGGFVQAMIVSNSWNIQVQLEPGFNILHVQSVYTWGNYVATFTVNPVIVTLDQTLPQVVITSPPADSLVRSGNVNITWQSSDNEGLAKTELSDGTDWIEVQGNYYELRIASGHHTVRVRVTDYAGNEETSSVVFESDSRALSFNGPYYGLPIMIAAVGAVLAGLLAAMNIRRKRRNLSRPPTTPPPSQPPGA